MKINWLPQGNGKWDSVNSLLQIEYRFRSRITRLLLEHLAVQDDLDFESIYFDFHTDTESFEISSKTPEPIYSRLLELDHLLK